jgi:adenylosuccinate synthase
VVTKLDVFDTQPEIQVCVGYTYKGTPVTEMPAEAEKLAKVTPVYRSVPGWRTTTYGVSDPARLPAAAKEYLRFISGELDVELGMISTGPQRDATIVPEDTKLASWL